MSVDAIFEGNKDPMKRARASKTLSTWKGPLGCSLAYWYKDDSGKRVMLKQESATFCENERISHELLSMLDLVLPKTKAFNEWLAIQHIEDDTGHLLEFELSDLRMYDPVLRMSVPVPESKWINPYDIVAIAIFDAISMNQDRHGRNALVVRPLDPQAPWRVAPIDHTHTDWETHAWFKPNFPDYKDISKLLGRIDPHEQEILHDMVLAQLKRGLRGKTTFPRGVKAEIRSRIKVMEEMRAGTLERWAKYGVPAERAKNEGVRGLGSCGNSQCSICGNNTSAEKGDE